MGRALLMAPSAPSSRITDSVIVDVEGESILVEPVTWEKVKYELFADDQSPEPGRGGRIYPISPAFSLGGHDS